MKKLKTILGAVLSLAVVGAIVVLMLTAADSESMGAITAEIITPIDVQLDNDHPDELQTVAENNRFVLSANLKKGIVQLQDKTNGGVWSSSPQGYEENEAIKGAPKVMLGSLLNIRYADRDSNTTLQNSVAGCVNKNNLGAKKITNGVRFDFYFEKEGFLIPLEITLTDKGLMSRVVASEIKEESNLVKLTTVIPLPNFGAGCAMAETKDEGYVLVPDGSGALIPFEMGLGADYSQRVYGTEWSVVEKTKTTSTGSARLPVFGAVRNGSAYLAIITQGASRAKINAEVATAKSPYGKVSAEFIYRESTVVDVSQKTFEFTKVNMFEPQTYTQDSFCTEYRVVGGEQADYVDMANTYRDYLIHEQGMEPLTEESAPLYVELLGGVMRQESVLGIPVNKVVPITAYDDVTMFAQLLKDNGVEQMVFNYVSWGKGGTQNRLPTSLATESGLGGKGDFERMLAALQEQKVSLYLDLNFTDMTKSQWGYSTKRATAHSVLREPAIQYQYKMSTFQINSTAKYRYLLSPNNMKKAVGQLLGSVKNRSFTGYSANTLGQKLYSDFGENFVGRSDAETIWTQALSDLRQGGDGLLLAEANAYAFPYATDLTDVPVGTSDFLAQGRSVPFYQTALHGLVSMAVPAINGAEDSRQTFLKALETGTNLKYTFGARNFDKLKETSVSDLAYIDYTYWLEEATAQYKDAAGYLAKVSNQPVKSHTQLADGVFRTLFANSMGVTVNYTAQDVTVDGITVPANGYAGIGW